MCSPLNGYFCQLVVAVSALKRYDHLRLHACDFANYARRCTQANRVTIPQCMWIGQSWNSYWRLTVNIKCWVVLCSVSFLIVLSNLEIHNTTIHAVLLPLSFLQQLTSLSLSLCPQDSADTSPVLGQPIKFEWSCCCQLPLRSCKEVKGSEPRGWYIGMEVRWLKRGEKWARKCVFFWCGLR